MMQHKITRINAKRNISHNNISQNDKKKQRIIKQHNINNAIYHKMI